MNIVESEHFYTYYWYMILFNFSRSCKTEIYQEILKTITDKWIVIMTACPKNPIKW